ncbi:MAG: hypothetical protein GY861_21260 [bacterium]|nr:hypothetical protein [bacterium]
MRNIEACVSGVESSGYFTWGWKTIGNSSISRYGRLEGSGQYRIVLYGLKELLEFLVSAHKKSKNTDIVSVTVYLKDSIVIDWVSGELFEEGAVRFLCDGIHDLLSYSGLSVSFSESNRVEVSDLRSCCKADAKSYRERRIHKIKLEHKPDGKLHVIGGTDSIDSPYL